MAINFSVGEYVVINKGFVDKTLPGIACSCNAQTLVRLGYLGQDPSRVAEVGNITVNGIPKSYARVVPSTINSPNYNGNRGTTLLFCSDVHLNSSLEVSTAYVADKCTVKVQNDSGSLISKGQFVYQTNFDNTLQLPTVDLASAAAAGTAAYLGLATSDIADGDCGTILVDGSFESLNTGGFSVNDTVYLSDTPGAISTSAGTVQVVVGKVLFVSANKGTIQLIGAVGSTTISMGGGGGGSGFFTDGTGTNAAIGKGATAPTAEGDNGFAHGDDVNITSDCEDSFAQGDRVDIASTNSGSIALFGQGERVTLTGYNACFVQGKYVSVTGTAGNNLATFAQGSVITATNVGGFNLIQGGVLDLNLGDGYGNLIQGADHTLTGGSIYKTFIQGIDNDTNSGDVDKCMMQGQNNTISGPAENCFAQGESHDIDPVNNSFAQGDNHNIEANGCFAQGRDHSMNADYSFAQGYNNRCYQARTFTQGVYASAYRADQKSWGSNRQDSRGDAQSSKIIKHVQTTDATPTTLLSFNTQDDKCYSIRVNVAARSSTVQTENASFAISQVLANNNGGTLTLTGAPVSLTKIESVVVLWTVQLIQSGTDIVVQVTGAGANTIEWCCDFEFVEVYAD